MEEMSEFQREVLRETAKAIAAHMDPTDLRLLAKGVLGMAGKSLLALSKQSDEK